MMHESLKPIHGGMPEAEFKRFGLRVDNVLDFSVNLNPFGPPQIIKENWLKLFKRIDRYPHPEGRGIVDFYRYRFGIKADCCLSGNGSTELIYLIPRALHIRRAVVIMPSYYDYMRSSTISGAEIIPIFLSSEDSFSLPDMDTIKSALKDADAIWLGRPNNPTGTLFKKEKILYLADNFPSKWILVDEAFIQFLKDWEHESLLFEPQRYNLVVVHSLTKFYSLAGIRAGAVIAHPDVIERIKRLKEPWTVNGVAEEIARLLIRCEEYEEESRREVLKERDRVYEILKKIDGVLPYPSVCNFLLCRWDCTGNLDDLICHLLKNRCYVRDCRNFQGLEGNFFRLAIRRKDENNRLLRLLKEVNLAFQR